MISKSLYLGSSLVSKSNSEGPVQQVAACGHRPVFFTCVPGWLKWIRGEKEPAVIHSKQLFLLLAGRKEDSAQTLGFSRQPECTSSPLWKSNSNPPLKSLDMQVLARLPGVLRLQGPEQALASLSSPDERCYSFCFPDDEISHFLGSLFIESAAHIQG